MDNDSSFALSEVIRKLANLIRIGKVSEIKQNLVKVKIDRVTTGWLPIITQTGDTSVWLPLTEGELVVVFSPYGESAQSFVLRSINYDNFKAPDEDSTVNFTTKSNVKVQGAKKCQVKFDGEFDLESDTDINISGLETVQLKSTDASIKLGKDSIILKSGNATISISDSGITLSCGSSSIRLNDSNISLDSGSISTNPPVCMCGGM